MGIQCKSSSPSSVVANINVIVVAKRLPSIGGNAVLVTNDLPIQFSLAKFPFLSVDDDILKYCTL